MRYEYDCGYGSVCRLCLLLENKYKLKILFEDIFLFVYI